MRDDARAFGTEVSAYAHHAMYETVAEAPQSSVPERASSTVEYVGLGAIAATLVSGIAAAIDSTAGDRFAAAIVRRLLAAISGGE